MDIDLDLYRHELRVSSDPLVRLSALDISPERPQRTFVFIHGFGGQAAQWHYQMQEFAVETRVVALDLRGHGLSDKPGKGYDMPQFINDLETALTLLKVKGKIVLVGHSFGGAVVTEDGVGAFGSVSSPATGGVGGPALTKLYTLPPGLFTGQLMRMQAVGIDPLTGWFRTNCETRQF